jgi:hypothetical protein
MSKSQTKTGYALVTLMPAKGAEPVAPGGKIEVLSGEFDDLVARGFVSPRPPTSAEPLAEEPKAAPKPSGKQLDQAIAEAIAQLDPKVEEAWTGSGKPNVHALEKLLGFDIDGADRDRVWAEVQKGGGLLK